MDEQSLRAKGIVFSEGQAFAPAHYRVKRAGLSAGGSWPRAQLEQHCSNGAVGALPVQEKLGSQFFVRVTSFRKRLLDDDNLCEKYHVDLCRYAGALPSDAPGTAQIEVTQQKVGPKEPERVLIEIFRI